MKGLVLIFNKKIRMSVPDKPGCAIRLITTLPKVGLPVINSPMLNNGSGQIRVEFCHGCKICGLLPKSYGGILLLMT